MKTIYDGRLTTVGPDGHILPHPYHPCRREIIATQVMASFCTQQDGELTIRDGETEEEARRRYWRGYASTAVLVAEELIKELEKDESDG